MIGGGEVGRMGGTWRHRVYERKGERWGGRREVRRHSRRASWYGGFTSCFIGGGEKGFTGDFM